MRRTHWLIVPLLLTGCGSDDDRSPTPTPTTTAPSPTPSPSPTPAPSPTPSPAPTPSDGGYTPYAQLTGTVALPTAQAGYLTRTSPPTSSGFRAFGQGVTIQYDAGARSYTVPVGSSTETFVASEIDASAPAGTIRYAKPNGHSLSIVQQSASGRGFDYIRFARLVSEGSSGPLADTFLTGIATRGADVPDSGTATFSRTAVVGEAYVTTNGTTTAYGLTRSTLTLTVDYATQKASGRMVIVGTPTAGGSNVTLSTIDVTADFGGNGTLAVVSGGYTFQQPSTLFGALFGPRGSEAGLLFYLQGQNAAGSSLTLVAAGAAGT